MLKIILKKYYFKIFFNKKIILKITTIILTNISMIPLILKPSPFIISLGGTNHVVLVSFPWCFLFSSCLVQKKP
jgi:hypothetical protein